MDDRASRSCSSRALARRRMAQYRFADCAGATLDTEIEPTRFVTRRTIAKARGEEAMMLRNRADNSRNARRSRRRLVGRETLLDILCTTLPSERRDRAGRRTERA